MSLVDIGAGVLVRMQRLDCVQKSLGIGIPRSELLARDGWL